MSNNEYTIFFYKKKLDNHKRKNKSVSHVGIYNIKENAIKGKKTKNS